MKQPRISEKFVPIIFASGKGTRLRPLTQSIPKPLLPVVDGLSLLDLNICRMVDLGLKRVLVNYSYRRDLYEEIAEKYKGQISVELVEDTDVIGQGGILCKVSSYIGKEKVIIGFNGDTYVKFDLAKVLCDLSGNHPYVFSAPDVTTLPLDLICGIDDNLFGLNLGNGYFYTDKDKLEDSILKNYIGIIAVPNRFIPKVPQGKSKFMGLFGEDDLMHKMISNGITVYVKDLNVSGFYSMNTLQEYEEIKMNLKKEGKSCL